MQAKDNVKNILNRLSVGNDRGEPITLVGATKTVDVQTINSAISAGLSVVAENKVQEFRQKHSLISGATQHFIGHLQTNKIKYLVGNVDVIQSVDNLKLATAISERAKKLGIVQKIFLEVNIGRESSKSGFAPDEIFTAAEEADKLLGIKITGLMAMLPQTDDEDKLASLCEAMRGIYDELKNKNDEYKYLSVGMSDDYQIAVRHGSNMVRLGSRLFGKRNYGEKENGII